MAAQKPEIVFLDAGTLDFGDISLSPLKACGRLVCYDQTRPDRILSRIRGAGQVITNKVAFDRRTLENAEGLRCIHISATGVNIVDLEAARKAGIAVTNVAGYSTETVVQFTLAFILALAGNLINFNRDCHAGKWSRSPYFVLPTYPVIEVAGKKLGIIGCGTIGSRVAEAARALGMEILIARIPGRTYAKRARRLPLGSVLKRCDFLSIHAPLTPQTKNLIGARELRSMKRGAFVINLARGGIVNEPALRRALDNGHLGGAACDVLTSEPPARDHCLIGAPRLLMTPHMAWASLEARQRLTAEVAANIRAFQQGKKRNRVV